jgi:hypothetical protein
MSCDACHEAQTNAASHIFNANCLRCSERHFSHLQVRWESQRAGRITEPYMAALVKCFGADGYKAAHVAIKGWVARIEQCKQSRGAK